MRICPVCRTPNLPTDPVCANCRHQFFATHESRFRTLDEATRTPAALGVPSPETEEFEIQEFEEVAPPKPAVPRPAQAPPSSAGGPRRATQGPRPKKAPRRANFPRVPKDLQEGELEPLRQDAMQKGLICMALIVVVSVAVPAILSALGVSIREIGILGIVNYVIIFVFYSYARAVGRASKKAISGVEQAALSRVKTGGFFLIAIPLLGSVAGQVGVYFQTPVMHPIFYALAGLGIFYTLAGVTSLKERYSYYAVFEFGFLLLLVQPLPALLPGSIAGLIVGNVYWFQTTFLFLALGFFAIAFALRKMRAGQYEALEQEVVAGQKALELKKFDAALAHFDRAVTIAHSLYSEKLFKSTKTGQRVLPADYYLPWVGKATALALSGRGSKALTILDIVLEVDGTNADLWMNKGEVLLSLGRPAEGYIAFETAQRLNPGLQGIAQNKQRALELLKRRLE